MTLKCYAAIVTGALAMVLMALLLWAGTQLPLQDVLAFALVAYYAGLIGAFAVIEWIERRRHRKRAAQIVTLVRGELEQGKEMAQ